MSARATAPIPRMLWMQFRAQVLGYLRIPAFSVTTVALPVMFFTFFGLAHTHDHFADGVNVGVYLLASFGAYSVSSTMVFSFGIGVATARGQKTDVLQRAMPLPGWVAIAANVLNAVLFAFASLVVLFLFGALAGGIRLDAQTWLTLTARLLAGSLPLVAMGMAIGYSASPGSAPAIANLVYLPMAFASGLFVPLSGLPAVVQTVAPFLPTYHYGQLAWGAVNHADEPLSRAVLGLAIWSVVLFALAVRAFQADQARKFG